MSEGQQQDPNTNDPGAQEPPVDWHDKFLGQKKVNGDLEAKLKAAYEKADRVDDLEKQVADWEKRGKEFDSAQATIAGLQKQVLQANVTAAATGKLINPGDALKLIDFSDLTADDQEDTTRTRFPRKSTLWSQHIRISRKAGTRLAWRESSHRRAPVMAIIRRDSLPGTI